MSRSAHTISFERPGVPLAYNIEDIPEPGPGETLVRMTMAGICGTEAHRLAGDLAAADYPVCFGHEVVGVIEALGEGVTTDFAGTPIAVGDRLYWCPPEWCGECWTCTVAGQGAACERMLWPVPFGSPNAAGFRELATLGPLSTKYRIPDGTSSESVIAFGCAMPTAMGAFRRLGPVSGTVVIQGSGPVGLASTVLASIGGADQVIVIGDPENRLEVARKLGATETIAIASTTLDERRARIMELTNGHGADIVIEAAGRAAAFPEGLGLLGYNARYVIVGLYSGDAVAPIDPVRLNNYSQRIIGSLGMPREDFLHTVELATAHGERLGFADLITHRFPLSRTEEGIATAARGESVKAVVIPD
ncbi:MAG: hypothetical protein JWQ19_2980 [Subtercola sp.]|nr:hypothetical protein [Subtercola sp.]